MNANAWVLLLSFVFMQADAVAILAGDPNQKPIRELSDDEKAEYELSGKWQLKAATYQSVGTAIFTFDGDILVISRQAAPEAKRGDYDHVVEWMKVYRYRLDLRQDPRQILITPVNGERRKKEEKRYFEFRDGTLWISTDDSPRPKGRSALKDYLGVEGLERIKEIAP